MNKPTTQSALTTFLQDLNTGISEGHKVAGVTFQVTNESDLEKFVRVGADGDQTLLRLLGYTEDDVEDHPTKQLLVGRVQYSPDYVLRSHQRPLAVIDLKRPDEDLDNTKWSGQIISYCQQVKVPLGILFNGLAIRVFINTADKQLNKNVDLFLDTPVASASHPDINGIASILSVLSFASLSPNPVSTAKTLARRQRATLNHLKRRREIMRVLQNILSENVDCDIEELLDALVRVATLWVHIDPKPTTAELLSVYNESIAFTSNQIGSRPHRPSPFPLSPAIRRKIAEICQTKGWDAISNANIQGLRFRMDGIEQNGYCLIPSNPNVPQGLCVQRTDSSTAKRILDKLKELD